MKNQKLKAITPIVTTILLVVVAVILVTIVLNWGRVFTTTSLNKAQGIELTKSDATSFVYPTQLKDGIIQFNYSPPSSESFGDIVIKSYKVLSDSGETPDTNLSSSYTLKQGSNLIDLTSFSSLGLTSNTKVTLVLQTTDNTYLDIKNITNYYAVPVLLPYVLTNSGDKLYIHPSDSPKVTWENATFYCENLDSNGYDDWYLPSMSQLADIWFACPDQTKTTACMNEAINKDNLPYTETWVDFIGNYYWSSTEYGAGHAYAIGMNVGFIDVRNKPDFYYVRCVRDQ
jgi:flagellin-like protein